MLNTNANDCQLGNCGRGPRNGVLGREFDSSPCDCLHAAVHKIQLDLRPLVRGQDFALN